MSSDPRVTSAIAHWAPRFVANGVALTDFEEVTASIAAWDDWCSAWCARAEVYERLGREALAAGKLTTAGEHLQRAGVYYHFGKFLFVHDVPQMRAAHMKAIACRTLALPHLNPPGERVEIPYEGKILAGILRKPEATTRPPVVVMAMGLDSAKEESAAYEEPFLARGMATLVFDGPGQAEAEYDFPIRGDYEVPVDAVLDYVETRHDLDRARIGLWGVSLGGYYAPRAAAHHKRVKACIALSGPYDWAEAWDSLPELTRAAFRVRSHSADDAEAKRKAATLTLKGVAGRITCPLYVIAGKRDGVIPWQHAQRLADEAKGPVSLHVFEDGNHVVNNRPFHWRSASADWMADQLGA
jgi:2,6-dihydroxypseudooxynicotine hydrolase